MMTTGEKMIWAAAFVQPGGGTVASAVEEAAERVVQARHAAKNTDDALSVSGMALAMLREMVGEEAASDGTHTPSAQEVAKVLRVWMDEKVSAEQMAEGILVYTSGWRAVGGNPPTRDPLAAVREHVRAWDTDEILLSREAEQKAWIDKLRALVGAKR